MKHGQGKMLDRVSHPQRRWLDRHFVLIVTCVFSVACTVAVTRVWNGAGSRENLPYEEALTIIESPENHPPHWVQSAAFHAKTAMKRGILDLKALTLLEGAEHAKTRTDAEVHLAWLRKHMEDN